MQAAQAARAAAVAPLQAEVARLTERVQGLQQLHASELADLEAAARQQTAAAQADAQAAVDRLTASGASLQQRLQGESQRAEGLAADVARMQVCPDVAQHAFDVGVCAFTCKAGFACNALGACWTFTPA